MQLAVSLQQQPVRSRPTDRHQPSSHCCTHSSHYILEFDVVVVVVVDWPIRFHYGTTDSSLAAAAAPLMDGDGALMTSNHHPIFSVLQA